jgi:hypothetical protein
MVRIRRGGVIVTLVLVQLIWTIAAMPVASDHQETGNATSKAPADIARMLADQKKIVIVPGLNKKVSAKIEKEDPQYGFAQGQSPAVLFNLPESKFPYTLKVSSVCNCLGFSKSIFVPSGVFLNADFIETAKLEEDDLKSKGSGVEALLLIEGQRLSDRYLLVYSRGDLLGQTAGKIDLGGANGLAAALLVGAMKQSRAAHGKVELEAAPPKPKK